MSIEFFEEVGKNTLKASVFKTIMARIFGHKTQVQSFDTIFTIYEYKGIKYVLGYKRLKGK